MPRLAQAQTIDPGDVLIANLYGGGQAGEIYEVQPGGDVSGVPVFAAPPLGRVPLSMCRRPDGAILVSTCCGTGEGVYVINSGSFVTHATGLSTPGALLCDDDGTIWVSTLAEGVIDITAGGDYTGASPFAIGIQGHLIRTQNQTLYVGNSQGLFDITAGGDFSAAPPFVAGNLRGIAELAGNLLAMDAAGRIADVTTGGNIASAPTFATVAQGSKMVRRWTRLWAMSGDGRLYDVSAGGNYAPGQEYAYGIGGMVVDAVVVPECGNGYLEDDEICDDGNQVAGDGCDAACQPEAGAGGAGGDGDTGGTGSGPGGGGGADSGGNDAGPGGAGGAGGSGAGPGAGGGMAGASSTGGKSSAGGAPSNADSDTGCSCRVPDSRDEGTWWALAVVIGAGAARRYRYFGSRASHTGRLRPRCQRKEESHPSSTRRA